MRLNDIIKFTEASGQASWEHLVWKSEEREKEQRKMFYLQRQNKSRDITGIFGVPIGDKSKNSHRA